MAVIGLLTASSASALSINQDRDETPGPHVIVESGTNDVHVFYRTPGNQLGHNWYDMATHNGWGSAVLSSPVAGTAHPVIDTSGGINVFFRTSAGGLGHEWWEASANEWRNEVLGGEVASEPEPVVEPGTNDVHVFYRTPGGKLGHNWYDMATHNGWGGEVLNASVTSNAHAVIDTSGGINVFFRTSAGGLGHEWWEASANEWRNEVLGGEVATTSPRAVTVSATAVGKTGATLNATVNPMGSLTSYYIEYGPSIAYGSKQPGSSEYVPLGYSAFSVAQTLTGLNSQTTYHYRVVATSPEGTSYGEDKTFTTEALGIGDQLKALSVTEPFNGSTESVANFNAKWSALGWAAGTTPKGSDTTTGWGPSSTYSTINGAYYNTALTGAEPAAVATMATNPGSNTQRYFSLWLDMPTPGSTRAGYELRFTNTATNVYEVKLAKWVGGSETVLASKTGYSFLNGNSFAVVDQGGTVSAWTDTGSGFNQMLSATDSTFSGGNAGLYGAGNVTRLTKLAVGSVAIPDTTISTGSSSGVVVPNVAFSFTSSESGASFECSLDTSAYESCSSPKAYQGLAEGAHTFYVRAKNSAGTDQTPAQQEVQVASAYTAATKVPIRDDFGRQEVPLATGKWTKTGWAAEIGGSWAGSWHGFGAGSGLAGAYWNPTAFSDAGGAVLVGATVGTGSTPAGQYVGLWLNMPSPGGARSGYEARFSGTGSGSVYEVALSKWVSGTRTILATAKNFSLPAGTKIAFSETGGNLTLWTGSGSLSPLLSATDSTYSSGYTGIEVNGGAGTYYNYRSGNIDLQSPDTTIQSGPSGSVFPSEVTFTFTSSESGGVFECSVDGGQYTACSSPKTYPNLTGGSHKFQVRAIDAVANVDGTPAERMFQVLQAPDVVTEATTEVGGTKATLHAGITPNGLSTTYQFEYGPTTSYGSKAPLTAKGIGSGTEAISVSEILNGLSDGTTYHYRVIGQNQLGTSFGQDKTFETLPLPKVTTEVATGVGANEAILTAAVDPNGHDTTYRFEYGTTAGYGQTTPVVEDAGNGDEPTDVREAIAWLDPVTTYHYRIVATSPAGTVAGSDETFTTGINGMSAAQVAQAYSQEGATTSAANGSAPDDYIGLMWSGDLSQMTRRNIQNAVKKSHAKILRLEMARGGNDTYYEEIFRRATSRGITILPYIGSGQWPTDQAGQENWISYTRETVEKYGPGGTFWGTVTTAKHPPHAWELWNEPNLGRHYSDHVVHAAAFGDFFAAMSSAAKAGANARGQSIEVLMPGLFGFGSSGCKNDVCNKSITDFIKEMSHKSSYDAVNIHPYVFKAGDGNAPSDHGDVVSVRERIRGYISETRQALRDENENSKDIWITELGFPVKYDPSIEASSGVPGVSEGIQADLVETVLSMIVKNRVNFGIAHAFYYNLQDWADHPANTPEWAYRGGLRRDSGQSRPSWRSFANIAGGDGNWPPKVSPSNHHVTKHFNRAVVSTYADFDGQQANVKVEYGGESTPNSYPYPPVLQTVEAEEEGEADVANQIEVDTEIPNLQAEKIYHYRIVITNEGGETESDTGTFETPPSTTTSADVKQELNGEPGWVTVGGYIHEGAEPGVVGPPIPNVWVNVNFWKKENGDWVYKSTAEPHPVTNSEGYYVVENRSVGKGIWKVRTVLPSQGDYDQSESDFHEFTIKNGYQLVAKHSGKCLDVAGESTANGAILHQWECLNPATQQNQVFTLQPFGNSYYNLVARHSGRCVDVANADQQVGAPILQWTCAGAGQTNQIWQGVPMMTEGGKEYVNFRAKHSGQCLDVSEGSGANGAPLHQWTCLGTGQPNQLWTFKSVESNDIATHTYITPGETLYGEPGYISISGTVDVGAYPTTGKWVNVNFEKENASGGWNYVSTIDPHPTLNSEGRYSYDYWGVGVGNWRVRTVFPGEGALSKSESNYHYFHIGPGFRLINRYSDKCLTVWNNSGANGAAIVQWDCSPGPWAGDGQVLTLVPLGGGYYNIRFNRNVSISRCADVTNVSSEPHALIQLWECLGFGQANQLWEKIPIQGQSPWVAFRVKHSGQCLDNTGPSNANGNKMQQYSCNWSGAQQWQIQPIG